MTAKPEPLVPYTVDLRDYPKLPLDFRRLFRSDTWALGTPEEKIAALHLWCESWHQEPAASLPSEERVLATLSAAGPRWKKIRNHAMRGWILCSDGRWYHPVIAEMAIEAYQLKREKSKKGKAGADARWGRGNTPGLFPDATGNPQDASGNPPDATGIAEKRREEKGIGNTTPPTPSSLPDWIDKDAWAGFVEMRQRRKFPLDTERARKGIIDDLTELKAQGQDPNKCLDQSTKLGWRGVFPVRSDRKPTGAAPAQTDYRKGTTDGRF